MAVSYVTLYLPDGTPVQVVEGGPLHKLYVARGADGAPPTPGPVVRLDPFPQYVDQDELTQALGGAAASDTAVAALVTDTGSQTRGALRAAFERPVKWTSPDTFQITLRRSAFAIGVDPVDSLGYFATTTLYTSTDNLTLTTRSLPPGVASAVDLNKVVRWGNYVYCQARVSGTVRVFRSLPPGADLSWTEVRATAATDLIGPCLNRSAWGSSDFLYAAEYGDPAAGPSIHRSPDGVTWETVLGPIAGLRHFHAVAADPYNPGHVYATAGDGDGRELYRSTDYGAPGSWQLLLTSGWQAVQISFSEDWVWFAGDSPPLSVFVIDRDNPTQPIIASSNWHALTAVPGGLPGRGLFTDGGLTSGSNHLTSATAAFTASDVGKMLRFANISAPIDQTGGLWIASYVSPTDVTLNKNAGGTSTNRQFFVDGDSYYQSAFYGAVDPETGIYYCVSNSGGGTRSGLFALPQVGGRLELLESLASKATGEVFFRDGKVWCQAVARPLATLAA